MHPEHEPGPQQRSQPLTQQSPTVPVTEDKGIVTAGSVRALGARTGRVFVRFHGDYDGSLLPRQLLDTLVERFFPYGYATRVVPHSPEVPLVTLELSTSEDDKRFVMQLAKLFTETVHWFPSLTHDTRTPLLTRTEQICANHVAVALFHAAFLTNGYTQVVDLLPIIGDYRALCEQVHTFDRNFVVKLREHLVYLGTHDSPSRT